MNAPMTMSKAERRRAIDRAIEGKLDLFEQLFASSLGKEAFREPIADFLGVPPGDVSPDELSTVWIEAVWRRHPNHRRR